MASPGLKPVLFSLAVDTAKPAGGYAAAQWSNRTGLCLHTKYTEILTGHFSIHLNFCSAEIETGARQTHGLSMKRKDTTCCLRKATQTVWPVCPCLLAKANPTSISTTSSDR